MNELLLRFVLSLDVFDAPRMEGIHGPTFYRWLPYEDENKIEIELEDKEVELLIWFEQRGYENNGIYIYDIDRSDINPELIHKQGHLDGGPIFGSLKIKNIPDKQYKAIIKKKSGDKYYVKFTKKV